METWKPVVGWEGIYEVSDLGRVRRIISGVSTYAGRISAPIVSTGNRRTVRLRYNGREAKPLIHKIITEAFLGPRPKGLEINHKNGDPTNNRLDNLEYVTPSENMFHAYRIGIRKPAPNYGEDNGSAKLNREQVAEIRRLYAMGGNPQHKLAARFGVTQPLIGMIVRREIWKDPITLKNC